MDPIFLLLVALILLLVLRDILLAFIDTRRYRMILVHEQDRSRHQVEEHRTFMEKIREIRSHLGRIDQESRRTRPHVPDEEEDIDDQEEWLQEVRLRRLRQRSLGRRLL